MSRLRVSLLYVFLMLGVGTCCSVALDTSSSTTATTTAAASAHDMVKDTISMCENEKRNMAISSDCLSEISSILANPDLWPDFDVSTWPQEVIGSICVISGSSNFTCDYSLLEGANQSMEQACVAAKGRSVEVTYIMSGTVDGTAMYTEINNMVVCIGSSCDPDETANYIEDYAKIFFELEGNNVDVNIDVTNYMTSAPTVSHSPTISLAPTPDKSSSSSRFSMSTHSIQVLVCSIFLGGMILLLA
jgi:hypothetical protein